MTQILNINFFNILIISITIQGLIFSLILSFSKKYNRSKPNLYLAQLILFLSLSNLYYWFIDTRIVVGWWPYRYLFVPWELLIMPFFYYFVDAYLNKATSIKKYLLIPFIISLSTHLYLIGYRMFFATHEEGIELSKYINRIGEYITPVFSVIVIVMIFRMITKYERKNKTLSNNIIIVETKWLKQLLYSGIGVCVVLVLYILFKLLFTPKSNEYDFVYYFVWIGMGVIIYLLGYGGIYYIGIFNQRNEIRKSSELENNKQTENKYNIKRFEEFDDIICAERLYSNPNCSLTSLSERFQMSEGYLSQLINTFSGSSTTTYINNLRLEEVNRMLQSNEYNQYTIVAISLEAGFNSKSTFYDAFKKNYGMTPSQFRKKIKASKKAT